MKNQFGNLLTLIESDSAKRAEYTQDLAELKIEYNQLLTETQLYEEAGRVLSAVSDEQLKLLLDELETFINSALAQIFPPEDFKYIKIDKTLYKQATPQLRITLQNASGIERDINEQEGTGVSQIISVLFSLLVVAMRKDRPLILLDECLSGLHNRSKQIMTELLKKFAQQGFQFMIVEYGIDNTGKIYNIERRNGITEAVPVNGVYNPNLIHVADSDDLVLDNNYVESYDE